MTFTAWIDVVAILLILICAVFGAIRGLSSHIAQVAALIISYKSAFAVSSWIKAIFNDYGKFSERFTIIMPIVIAFILVILLFLLSRYLITKCIKVLIPRPYDNILGFVFGAVVASLIIFTFFVIAFGYYGKHYDRSAFDASYTGKHLIPIVSDVVSSTIIYTHSK